MCFIDNSGAVNQCGSCFRMATGLWVMATGWFYVWYSITPWTSPDDTVYSQPSCYQAVQPYGVVLDRLRTSWQKNCHKNVRFMGDSVIKFIQHGLWSPESGLIKFMRLCLSWTLGQANATGSEVLKVSRKWQRGYQSDHLGMMIGGRLQNILFWLCAYRLAAI